MCSAFPSASSQHPRPRQADDFIDKEISEFHAFLEACLSILCLLQPSRPKFHLRRALCTISSKHAWLYRERAALLQRVRQLERYSEHDDNRMGAGDGQNAKCMREVLCIACAAD